MIRNYPTAPHPPSTYPWAAPDDPAAVKLPPVGGLAYPVVVGDVIVTVQKAGGPPIRQTTGTPVQVRGVNSNGRMLFIGPPLVAESGQSDEPHLYLLDDGRRIRVAYSYHKTGPSGRFAYVDIYDPAARGDVHPVTVRMPTDDQLEWAGGTAVQGALAPGRPITILDADGTLTPWRSSRWPPVAATSDVVVEGPSSDDVRKQAFQVVDRRTHQVLWGDGKTVYAVSRRAMIAGRTRHLVLFDLRTGRVLARSKDPLPTRVGSTGSSADRTQQHGDLLMTWQVAASTRQKWVHGGWNIGYYAVWQDNVYGFEEPNQPFEKNPMALWIPPNGTPYKFPVTGHAAPLAVTTDGHAVVLTATFRDRALYVVPLRH